MLTLHITLVLEYVTFFLMIFRPGSVIRRVHVYHLQLVLSSDDLMAYQPKVQATKCEMQNDSSVSSGTFPEEQMIGNEPEPYQLPSSSFLSSAKIADLQVYCSSDSSKETVGATQTVLSPSLSQNAVLVSKIDAVRIHQRRQTIIYKYPDDAEYKEVAVLAPARSRRGMTWHDVASVKTGSMLKKIIL